MLPAAFRSADLDMREQGTVHAPRVQVVCGLAGLLRILLRKFLNRIRLHAGVCLYVEAIDSSVAAAACARLRTLHATAGWPHTMLPRACGVVLSKAALTVCRHEHGVLFGSIKALTASTRDWRLMMNVHSSGACQQQPYAAHDNAFLCRHHNGCRPALAYNLCSVAIAAGDRFTSNLL
jgi:hypothetical protein